jgi:hypothetical protein
MIARTYESSSVLFTVQKQKQNSAEQTNSYRVQSSHKYRNSQSSSKPTRIYRPARISRILGDGFETRLLRRPAGVTASSCSLAFFLPSVSVGDDSFANDCFLTTFLTGALLLEAELLARSTFCSRFAEFDVAAANIRVVRRLRVPAEFSRTFGEGLRGRVEWRMGDAGVGERGVDGDCGTDQSTWEPEYDSEDSLASFSAGGSMWASEVRLRRILPGKEVRRGTSNWVRDEVRESEVADGRLAMVLRAALVRSTIALADNLPVVLFFRLPTALFNFFAGLEIGTRLRRDFGLAGERRVVEGALNCVTDLRLRIERPDLDFNVTVELERRRARSARD